MSALAKQCDSKKKHPEHEWFEGVFKRWCKGLKREKK
jgi:hypothetical protein